MRKELSEMTIEEQWELFPIFLVEHREQWKDDYRKIESELQRQLSDCGAPRISHIGSTIYGCQEGICSPPDAGSPKAIREQILLNSGLSAN